MKEYISECAGGAYVVAVCRPDLSYGFARSAQFSDPKQAEFKEHNSLIKIPVMTPARGLQFVKLDVTTIKLGLFIDAGFATNRDMTSQLGFLMVSVEDKLNADIFLYRSTKYKYVTKSVLAAELYAMVLGFDVCSTIRLGISDIFGKPIPLYIHTYSRSLYERLTMLNQTTERRHLIDLCMMRECYERRDVSEIFWIPPQQNLTDALTKLAPCKASEELMKRNVLHITPNA